MRGVSWRQIAILIVGAVLTVAGGITESERITSAGLSIVGAWITLVLVKGRHAQPVAKPAEPPDNSPPQGNPPGTS